MPNSISQVALAQVLSGHCLGLKCGWLWGALSRKQSLVGRTKWRAFSVYNMLCFSSEPPGKPSLGWEDPLEEGMATYFSILVWKIPMDRGTWRATTWRGWEELDTTEQLSTAQYSVSQSPISSFLLPKPKSICLTCVHHGNESKWCI